MKQVTFEDRLRILELHKKFNVATIILLMHGEYDSNDIDRVLRDRIRDTEEMLTAATDLIGRMMPLLKGKREKHEQQGCHGPQESGVDKGA